MHGAVYGVPWRDAQVCNAVHSGNHAVCIRGLEVSNLLHNVKMPSATGNSVCDAHPGRL